MKKSKHAIAFYYKNPEAMLRHIDVLTLQYEPELLRLLLGDRDTENEDGGKPNEVSIFVSQDTYHELEKALQDFVSDLKKTGRINIANIYISDNIVEDQ